MLRRQLPLTLLVLPSCAAAPAPEESRVFELANRERHRNGRARLVWDEKLAALARGHSRRMAENGFFGHEDPGRGSLRARLAAAGVSRGAVAENLHRSSGYSDPAQIAVEGWLDSEGHRRNLLDGAFTSTGIGVARARDGATYITQIFAGRR